MSPAARDADRPVGMNRNADRPIGVFDSGVGGLSVLKALCAVLPHERFVYFADTAHAPYGERSEAYVAGRSLAVAQGLIDAHGIKALVVACNTATAAAIHLLRAEHPALPVVGVEPALKPALAASQTHRIGVLATRGTLASAKFQALHASLAGAAQFVLQPCDGLAGAIEAGDATKTIALCARYTGDMGTFGTENGQIDTLVLGCTHYPFAADILRQFVGPAVHLIDTGEPVARHTRRLLAQAGALRDDSPVTGGEEARLQLLCSGAPDTLQAAAARWLHVPAARAQALPLAA